MCDRGWGSCIAFTRTGAALLHEGSRVEGAASLTDSVFGGRPRRGMSPTFRGRRPARNKAPRKRSSTCALVLRSSSEAQRARASCTAGSMRTSRVFLSGIDSSLSDDQNRVAHIGILVSFAFTTGLNILISNNTSHDLPSRGTSRKDQWTSSTQQRAKQSRRITGRTNGCPRSRRRAPDQALRGAYRLLRGVVHR